jgi:ethanolamine ammonia-lyase large subunit
MLNYQSTSFHDIPSVRRLLGKRPTPEFDAWCEAKGITRTARPGPRFGDAAVVA